MEERLLNRSCLFFFNWRIIALPNFVVFCQTPTWIKAVVLSAQSHDQSAETKQRRNGKEIPLSLLSFSFQCSVCSFPWLNSASLSSWQENLPWALSVRFAGQQIKNRRMENEDEGIKCGMTHIQCMSLVVNSQLAVTNN